MDKQLVVKRTLGCVCAATLMGAILATQPPLTNMVKAETLTNQTFETDDQISYRIVQEIREGRRGQLYGGYFRTWHDSAATKNKEAAKDKNGKVQEDEVNKSFNRPNTISDIPKEVDILFVFDNYVHEESPFWQTLKDDYIIKLHKQGTAVVQTIGVKELTGEKGISTNKDLYPDTPLGNQRLATDLVDKYVYSRGVDGLDIDVELHDYNPKKYPDQARRAEEVYKEIAKLIGKTGEDQSKLLIMDTTISAENNPLFREVAGSLDLLLRQYYGPQGPQDNKFKNIDNDWDGYRAHISPRQFMIGFSFYEENDQSNRWGDINAYDPNNLEKAKSIEGTRAKEYAEWQPATGGLKGGIFSYAIDRDGVPHPKQKGRVDPETDKIVKSTYSVSKALKETMAANKEYDLLGQEDFEDPALLAEIQSKVGLYKGDLKRFDGVLTLTDGTIKSLKGLEALENAKGLTLKGLTAITELKEDMLPKTVREKGSLVLEGMTGLKRLSLSNSNLETLEALDVTNLTALESFDISGNKIDLLSEEELLMTMLTTVKNHGKETDLKTTPFENQRPKGYYPSQYQTPSQAIPRGGDKVDIFKAYVFGTQTKQGHFVADETVFNNFKVMEVAGRRFIDPQLTYKDFAVSYDQFKVLQFNATLGETTARDIAVDKDDTYTVNVFNAQNETVHQMTVVVGEGKEQLTNLSLEATILKMPSTNDTEKRVLDNDRKSYFNSWSPKNQFVIDLGGVSYVEHWRMYHNVNSDFPNETSHHISEGSLLVPIDSTVDLSAMSVAERDQYIKDETKWQKVADLNQEGKVIEGEVSGFARYWMVDIISTKGGTKYDSPRIAELQLLGHQLDATRFEVAAKDLQLAHEEVKADLSEAVVKAFDERVTADISALSQASVNQAGLDAMADILETAAKELRAMKMRKAEGFSVQEQLRVLQNHFKTWETEAGNREAVNQLLPEIERLNATIDRKLGEEVFDESLEADIATLKDLLQKLDQLSDPDYEARIANGIKEKALAAVEAYRAHQAIIASQDIVADKHDEVAELEETVRHLNATIEDRIGEERFDQTLEEQVQRLLETLKQLESLYS